MMASKPVMPVIEFPTSTVQLDDQAISISPPTHTLLSSSTKGLNSKIERVSQDSEEEKVDNVIEKWVSCTKWKETARVALHGSDVTDGELMLQYIYICMYV